MSDLINSYLPRVGQALWGTRWQTDMAEALGVSDRTVRRWVAGERVPQGVWVDMIGIMDTRAAALNDLASTLRRDCRGTPDA